MRKIYVLDTNVLIHDPYCIFNFKDNEVVLPIFVIEEIDKLKNKGNTAHNARLASRVIENIRKEGSLSKGVELKDDIFFRVTLDSDIRELPNTMKHDIVDNQIISTTLILKHKNPQKKVVLVSKDVNMRIKADALGLDVEDYKTDKVHYSMLYTGDVTIDIDYELYKEFKQKEAISVDNIEIPTNVIITPNTFYRLRYKRDEIVAKLENNKLRKIYLGHSSVCGLRARNTEQMCAIDLLLDDNIKIVTLVGVAGTGKTLLAIASALESVTNKSKYKKILIARPIIPLGKEIGFIPGDEKEKMKPWIQPFYDNLDYLSSFTKYKSGDKLTKDLESRGILKIEALSFIRGRSIPNSYIIIDEAQNLTPLEVKTIITRVSTDTKIIFTGDPTQIDNPYLDKNSNGLSYLADRLKNERIVGHILLRKGERSEVAEIASKLL